MKLGMLTGIWYIADGASVFESLDRAAALGFHYVDLHGTFNAGPKHLSEAERVKVKDTLDALGLEPRNYVLHAPHNIASTSEAEYESSYRYLCEGIDMAVSWGINQIMFNAGLWDMKVSRREAWSKAVRFCRRVCDYAVEREVYIAQETEPYVWFLVNDMASSVRMQEDVNRSNFVNLIDLGHIALARERAQDISSLGATIVHAHLSDYEPMRHTNQIVGTGFTPVAETLEMLKAVDVDEKAKRFGYDELVVSFELGFPGDQIENPDEWVRQSIRHVQEAAPFLEF